jgi:rubredoxin
VKTSALREETSLVFDPAWPSPVCPRGNEHEWIEYPAGWVCDRCGAPVKRAEAQMLLGWWARIHVTLTASWPNN